MTQLNTAVGAAGGNLGDEIQTLVTTLVGNAVPYIHALQLTYTQTQAWAQRINAVVGQQAAAAFFATAVAGIGSAAAIAWSWHRAAGAIDEAVRNARALNTTANNILSWKNAMTEAGYSAESLVGNLKGLQQAIQKASLQPIGSLQGLLSGTGGALHRIGLSPRQLAGLPGERQLELIADGLEKVKNAQMRLMIANELFAGNGEAWLEILKGGSKAMAEMAAESSALNQVISQGQAESVQTAVAALRRLWQALYGVYIQITVAVAPVVRMLAYALTILAQIFGWLIIHLRWVVTLFGGLILISLVATGVTLAMAAAAWLAATAFDGLAIAIGLVQAALTLLTAHPLVAVITVIAALILLVLYLTGALGYLQDKMSNLWGSAKPKIDMADPIAQWQKAAGLEITGAGGGGFGALLAQSMSQTDLQRQMLNQLQGRGGQQTQFVMP